MLSLTCFSPPRRVLDAISADRNVAGVRHEGEPEGKSRTMCKQDLSSKLTWYDTGVMQKIAGIDCYVSIPKGEYPKDKIVLFLTDVFGIPLINNRVRPLDCFPASVLTYFPASWRRLCTQWFLDSHAGSVQWRRA